MPPSDNEIIDRLRKPLCPNPVTPTFRLGLVLNGTVAAGAWTAGVLDFLMEALDAWEAVKEDQRDPADPQIPQHRVRIDVLGGASGGGVCAALLARAASCDFTPARTEAGAPGNPFWSVWVEKLSIEEMLGTQDLTDPRVGALSILHGRAIDRAADLLLSWGPNFTQGVSRRAKPRAWLADPFRVLVTLTNLRGIPYKIDFSAGEKGVGRSSFYVSHADHALFAFPTSSGRTKQALDLRGDEWLVDPDFDASRADWSNFAAYAKATGAFPGGFPARRLSRPKEHYDWRAILLPGEAKDGQPAQPEVRLRKPAWEALPSASQADLRQGRYTFDCVDGGALNNQPVELVRLGMAGLGRSLTRDARAADAATLLIDPFAAVPECPVPDPDGSVDILDAGKGLIGAWTAHSRFATSDLLLALDPHVASRFLLTAGRTGQDGEKDWGGKALAGAGLGAFLGFFWREARVHDYLLGRKNCRDYLEKHFALDARNPLFAGFANKPAAREYEASPGLQGERRLQIVPLVAGTARQGIPDPDWPSGLQLDTLQDRIEDRLGHVVARLAEKRGLSIPCRDLAVRKLADRAATLVIEKVRRAAKAAGID